MFDFLVRLAYAIIIELFNCILPRLIVSRNSSEHLPKFLLNVDFLFRSSSTKVQLLLAGLIREGPRLLEEKSEPGHDMLTLDFSEL
jgi:hypothetical protein